VDHRVIGTPSKSRSDVIASSRGKTFPLAAQAETTEMIGDLAGWHKKLKRKTSSVRVGSASH